MFPLDDTIAAIASAPGGAARGIVRISGPSVAEIVAKCFQPDDHTINVRTLAEPTAIGGHSVFHSPHFPLPVELFLWPTARSYTRQPLAEFHTFGSPPILNPLLDSVCAAGARLAQPGEFTLRAFLAGRIDLTQAEAVLGVVDAADRRELDTALEQLAGGLSRPCNYCAMICSICWRTSKRGWISPRRIFASYRQANWTGVYRPPRNSLCNWPHD